MTCKICQGMGFWVAPSRIRTPPSGMLYTPCSKCNTSGVINRYQVCDECKGFGYSGPGVAAYGLPAHLYTCDCVLFDRAKD